MKRLTLLAATIFAGPALAQTAVPISSLPTASDTFDGTEYVAGIQQGISRKFPLSKTLNAAHFTFTPVGGSPSSLQTKLRRIVDLDDYTTGGVSDCAALTTAVAQNPHSIIRLPARKVTLGTLAAGCSINITSSGQKIVGTTVADYEHVYTTTLDITNPSLSPFVLASPLADGFTLEGMAISQQHATPTSGSWTPTAFAPVVSCSNVGARVTLKNLIGYGVYRLITASGCGRLRIDNVEGEWFDYGALVDKSYDSDDVRGLRMYSYWSNQFSTAVQGYVTAYTLANASLLVLGRADTGYYDHLFAINAKATVKFVNLGNGVATRAHFGKVQGDSSKYCFWWDASAQATRLQIDQWDCEHTDLAATNAAGSHRIAANSASFQFDAGSTNHDIAYGLGASEWADKNVIRDAAGSNTVIGQRTKVDRWGSNSGTDPAFYTVGGSQIMPGRVDTTYTVSTVYLDTSKDSVCYTHLEAGGLDKRTCSVGVKSTFNALVVNNAVPTFAWIGTSQPTNQKIWDQLVDSSGNLCTRAVNDAYAAAATALCLNRGSGATVGSIEFSAVTRFINNGTNTAGAWVEVDNSTAGLPAILAKSAGTPPTALTGFIISGGAAGSALPLSLRAAKTTAGWGVLATNEFVSETDGGANLGNPTYGRPDKIYAKSSVYAPIHIGIAAAPTASSCGGSPAVDANSSAHAGKFTIGTAATACTLTFATAYPTAAFCTVTPMAAPAAIGNVPYVSAQSRTAFTVSGGTESTSYQYACGGN